VVAGGGVDAHARILATELGKVLGQTVVVVNKPGAAATIGAAAVARAKPDGYTILIQASSSAVAVPHTMERLPYDALKAFAPVSLVARFPLAMVVNKDLPANNLKEFIALLKSHPNKYSYGHSGVGSQLELAGELFKKKTGTDMVGIPYPGTGAIVSDLLAGRVAMMFDGLPTQYERIKSGQVKLLALTSSERSKAAPETPTLKELYPDFDMPYWLGAYAPAGTPKPIVDKIAAGISKVMRMEAVRSRLDDMGSEAVGSTPEEFDKFWKDQYQLYGRIVKESATKAGG